MKQQIEEKLADGFTCIKLKIGAIDFDKELALLGYIRTHFSENQIEIRVDANGAFNSNEALYRLNQLADFKLHSIEQPIAKNNTATMTELCRTTPFPIALDEELIGISSLIEKEQLLEKEGRENPDYVIACVGGGSNAAGAYYHFLDNEDVNIIAVEAAGLGVDSGESAATSALGKVGVIHGSKTLLMQTTDGQITEP